MSKKTIYLLLALALPGLIFLFLKLFGKNHFEIPVYYSDGVKSEECRVETKGQYVVPDSILRSLKITPGRVALLVDESESGNRDIVEVRSKFAGERLQIVVLQSRDSINIQRLKICSLFLKDPWKLLLLDKQERIRGYYSLTNQEERDRFQVELDILMMQ